MRAKAWLGERVILLRTDAASGKPSLTRDSNVMLIPTGIVESAEHPVCLARDAACRRLARDTWLRRR